MIWLFCFLERVKNVIRRKLFNTYGFGHIYNPGAGIFRTGAYSAYILEGKKMRAREYRMEQQNRVDAMYSIIRGHHQADPTVIERFERSPYYPVLNFDKGVVNRDIQRWDE